MQMQNIQRYIIWGALAAVAYLMLIQWEKDYGKSSQIEQTQEAQQVLTKTNIQKENISDIKDDDLPQVDSLMSDKPTEQNKGTQNTNPLVIIESDVLNLTIDLKGGDIVKASLPKHSIDIEHPDTPVTLLQQDITRTYVAQSGLVGTNGPDANPSGRPIYRSEKNHYKLNKGKQKISVPLTYTTDNGVKITKIITLSKGSYHVGFDYYVENNTNSNWLANLFAQIKRDNSIDPLADTSLFAMKPFLGVAYWSEESKYNKISLSDIKDEPLKITHQGGWLAFVQHYFISAWVAPEEMMNSYTTRVNSKNQNIIGFTTEAINIAPGENKTLSYSFYAGPKDQQKLEAISNGLDLTVDYGWLWMIAQVVFSALIFIQSFVGNWGWSIVLLTCLVKLIFFPLNQYAFKSMANMRKLQPKMQRLKEQYGDDKQKLSQATMEMYRKEKINPLGSCLPMIVQMPVFISLYWVLSESVEIRHAPFFGWIQDLSIMDPYFVLPGLMAVSMVLQQKMSPMVFQDPMQERVMKFMPIMFAFFFLFFPAGLVLYWLVNNILTITQQWFINRNIKVEK
jgi:YidC/Oxa1 family membrane protein insertase